jgi:hypothetical protein
MRCGGQSLLAGRLPVERAVGEIAAYQVGEAWTRIAGQREPLASTRSAKKRPPRPVRKASRGLS